MSERKTVHRVYFQRCIFVRRRKVCWPYGLFRTFQLYREFSIMDYFNGLLLERLGWTHRLKEATSGRLLLRVLGCDVFSYSVCQHCLDHYFLHVCIRRLPLYHAFSLLESSQSTKWSKHLYFPLVSFLIIIVVCLFPGQIQVLLRTLNLLPHVICLTLF